MVHRSRRPQLSGNSWLAYLTLRSSGRARSGAPLNLYVRNMTNPAPLDGEVLKDLRDHTRAFLKLDLAYLAAGGAIITALKFGQNQLIEFGANVAMIVFALVFIGAVDTVIHTLVFNDWLSARTGSGKRQSSRLLRFLLDAQIFVHFIFVSSLVVVAVGFASGSQSVLTQLEARVMLQEEVELFIAQKGSPPKSMRELKATRSNLISIIEKLDGEEVRIEPTGPKSYKLTFAGWDKTLGTADDVIATQAVLLREVFESFVDDSKRHE